jgi:hypothetical protein
MTRNAFILTAAAFMVLAFLNENVLAVVAYDNFPLRQNQIAGYLVGSTAYAAQFQSGASGPIGKIDLAVNSVTEGATFSASLLDDAANNPGALLKTWSGVASTVGVNNFTTILNSDSSITLHAGQLYWLQVSATGNPIWSEANPGTVGRLAFSGFSFANTVLPGFAVTLVPEPAAASLAAFVLVAGLVSNRRCRRELG